MDSPFAHELGFLKKLDNAMQDIMTDGKIDAHDIPTLVCLFTDMLLTSSTTSTDPTVELQSLFDFIMTHYRLFPADGEAALDFKKMFDACVKLVLYKPPTTKRTALPTTTRTTSTEPEYSRLGFFIRLCTWCTSRKKKKAEITKVVQGSGAVVNTVVQDAVGQVQDAVGQVQDAVGQVQDAVGQVQDFVQDAVSLGQDAVSLGQDAVSLGQETVLSAVTTGLVTVAEVATAEAEAIWATPAVF